jgi:hypothetical protein
MSFQEQIIMRLLLVLTKVMVYKFGAQFTAELSAVENDIKMSEAAMQ